MSQKQISLVRFDFETQPFDGDARQAHQLIPFIQAKLGSHQLSYILNTKDYPDPKLNEFILLLERQHMELLDATTAQYKVRKKHYDELQLPLYHHRCRTIAEDPDKDDDQKTQEIANIPVPALPVLQAPPSEFNPGMESQLNKSRETIRRYDAAADQALQIIRPLLSPRLQNMCSPVLNDPVRNSRTKLLTLWTWLQAKRINDAQIVGEIRKDMSLLPEITTFDEAVTSLTLLNQLQTELVTLSQPLSDLELIIIHSNKFSEHDRFVPLKLKYLQRTTIQNTDLPPSFTTGPPSPLMAHTVT
jgi:hypothetical protein